MDKLNRKEARVSNSSHPKGRECSFDYTFEKAKNSVLSLNFSIKCSDLRLAKKPLIISRLL